MRKWLAGIIVSAATVPLLALGGIEGTMEYALDAPWRIEPSRSAAGAWEYGSIPIQVSIHDTDIIPFDSPGRTLGNFCELAVEEETPAVTRRRRFSLSDLEEIERSNRWLSPAAPDPDWSPAQMAGVLRHTVCRPDEAADRCESVRNLSLSAEWHAVAWYAPATRTPGGDVPLTLTAKVTRSARVPCTSTRETDFITLRSHVTVHLGEAPLPRFDSRWLYGDLHYHAQGTDNEGESAYNYRGVIRAMGALGLDFVLAAEHASNSRQIVDAGVDAEWCGVRGTEDRRGLRDMSEARFRFLREALHGGNGVNRTVALDGPGARAPQGYLSHGVVPQIFLGGEVDAIPETEQGERYIPYGNGLRYDTKDLDGGYNAKATCLVAEALQLREPAENGWLVRDVQGLNETDYGREHLVYLPGTATDEAAFVASDTGRYGGAGRRLAEAHDNRPPLLPEIEEKGYAFLAHPLNDGDGGPGPDGPPWSEFMLAKAWRSKGVLGLQFWNEPTRLKTKVLPWFIYDTPFYQRPGDAAEHGYDFDGSPIDHEARLAQSERKGFARGRFELIPYHDMQTRSFEARSLGVEDQLHHGAATWDRWLLRGLDTNETSHLSSWLPAGEPRRFFVAAGSDAHGDLNYRRAGYFTGTTKITDVAIAKARNLVLAGDPTLPRNEDVPPEWAGKPAERHSHEQVVAALAQGRFSATDGPALEIVVDRNGNGQIDDQDTPMGGVVELFDEPHLPVIVRWRSTEEFGGVKRLSIYVGTRNDRAGVDGSARVYAPAMHGPRAGADLPGSAVVESYAHSGRTYSLMEDTYWRDPTGLLAVSFVTPSLEGQRRILLPLSVLEASRQARGDRFYVRVFAETAMQDQEACLTSTRAQRQGACIRRYALTNPVWAITKTTTPPSCPLSERALDRDGDGLPDGCDRCPTTPFPACVVAPAPAVPVLGGVTGAVRVARP
jgi:hypothetical protein